MSVIEFNKPDSDISKPESSFSMHKRIADLGVNFTQTDPKELVFEANYGNYKFAWMEESDMVYGICENMRFYVPISGELVQEFGLTAEAAITTVSCFCERMKRNQNNLG